MSSQAALELTNAKAKRQPDLFAPLHSALGKSV
jgi:hypothetical protein